MDVSINRVRAKNHKEIMIQIPTIKKILILLEDIYFPHRERDFSGRDVKNFMAEYVLNEDLSHGWWEIRVKHWFLYYDNETYKKDREDIRLFLKGKNINNVVFTFQNWIDFYKQQKQISKYVVK
jgi:hypothetical protein